MKALVVDDEALVRNLTIRALEQEGFVCDSAVDGREATKLTERNSYEVVITDLKMPVKHGHALAVDLLSKECHPVVIVLTGLLEPAIAKDLLGRGVDDILFKPVEFPLLAAKVKAIADRAKAREAATILTTNAQTVIQQQENTALEERPATVDSEQFLADIAGADQLLPFSETSVDIYRMTNSMEFNAKELSEAISSHETLADQLIQLANCRLYNPRRADVSELEASVMRIGQKRVGELALATTVQSALLDAELPTQTNSLTWLRSVAAGMAVELLVDEGNHQVISDGLLMCAAMQELGRVVLTNLYPRQYAEMIEECGQTHASLFDLEAFRFPVTQSEALCTILKKWRIDESLYEPLQHVHNDFQTIGRLCEPLRSRVELVKLAGIVSRIAIAQWNPWDRVELPPADLADKLNVQKFASVVQDTRSNTECIRPNVPAVAAKTEPRRDSGCVSLPYYDAGLEGYDFLAEVIASMNISLDHCSRPIEPRGKLLANCLGIQSNELLSMVESDSLSDGCVICDSVDAEFYSGFDRITPLPCSYASLHHAVHYERNDNTCTP